MAGKHLGVSHADELQVDDLEKKVKQAVESNTPAAPPPKEPPKKKDSKKEKDRLWFKLMPDQKAGGDAPVFAALQGQSIMVHRNTWVPLPKKYLSCFKDAVETVMTMLEDGSNKISHVPRYNYQVKPLTDIDTPPDGGVEDEGF